MNRFRSNREECADVADISKFAIGLKNFFNLIGPRSGIFNLSSAKLLASAVSVLVLANISRNTRIDEFARFVVVLGLGAATSLIHDGGRVLSVTRAVALSPSEVRPILRAVLYSRLRLAILTNLGILAILITTLRDSIPLVLPMSISVLSTVVYTTVFGAFRAVGKTFEEAITEVASRLGVLAGVTLASRIVGLSDVRAYWCYSLADLFAAAFALRLLVMLPSRRAGNGVVTRDPAVNALSNLFASLVGGLVFRTTPLFLAARGRSEDVATFAIGSRILELALVPVGLHVGLSVGKFAMAEYRKVLLRQIYLCLVYGVLVLTALVLVTYLVPVLFGSAYQPYVGMIQLLMTTVIPHCCALIIFGVSFAQSSRLYLMFTLSFSIPVYLFVMVFTSKIGLNAFVLGSWAGLLVLGVHLLVATHHTKTGTP